MKAITLTQPWATLVAMGEKCVETRSWSTKHRGWIAIHAARALPKSWHPFRNPEFVRALKSIGVNEYGAPNLDRLPVGCVLAVARVVDVFPTEEILNLKLRPLGARKLVPFIEAKEYAFGDYSPERYAWVLSDIRRLRQPYPCKGAQRIWNLDAPEVERMVV